MATYGDLESSLKSGRDALGSKNLPDVHEKRIAAEVKALVELHGGPTATLPPKDIEKTLRLFSGIGSSELSAAKKSQDEAIVEKKVGDALAAVNLTVPMSTEDLGFADLTSTEKNTARARLSNRIFTDFANSPTLDIPTLLAQVDAYKTAGQISDATAEGVKTALNQKVADLAKSIQSDLDAGILTPAGVETRLSAIVNPDLRKLVGAKFGEVVDSAKYSTEADGFIATPTTTAALDAALASRPPAEAIGIRKALNEKVTKKADEYRQLIGTGQRSIEQIATEINGMPDSVQKDLLLKSFAAEFSSNKMREMLNNPTFANPITGRGEIARLVTEIQGSPEFTALPAYIRIAYEKALTAKMSQSEGTDNYYVLKHNQQEAERRLADQRLSEIRRKQTIRDIKNYYLPAVLIAVGLIGGGIAGGTDGNVLAGMLLGAAPGSIWLGRNLIAGGWDRTHRRETEAKMAEYAASSQEAYNNIHNIDAERELMPVRYLNEIVKVAAEVSWATQGKNSGLTREEFIKRYMEEAGVSGLDAMSDTLMNMNLTGNVAVTPAPAAPK